MLRHVEVRISAVIIDHFFVKYEAATVIDRGKKAPCREYFPAEAMSPRSM